MSNPTESLGKRLLKRAAQFSAGQLVSMVASIARVAVTARFLSTQANGEWLGLQLVLGYANYLHFGTLFGVFRSVPLLRAQGDAAGAEAERSTAFTFTAGMAVLSTLPLYLVIAKLVPSASARVVAAGVLLAGLQLLRSYYNTMFKAESRFAELAKALAWGGVLSLGGIAFIPRFGLAALLGSAVVQSLAEVVLLGRWSTLPKLGLVRARLLSQVRVGFLTTLTSVAVLLLTTVDRTVMIQRLGSEAAGTYYIGANIMVLMPIVAALPAAVLTPQFFERVGRGEDVLPLVDRPVRLASLGFAVLIGFGVVLLPPTIRLAWPKLVDGTVAAQAAMFATFPLVLAGLVTNVYYALDRQGLHVVIALAAAGAGFALAHAGVTLTHSVTGAAVGAAMGLYLYFPATAVGAFAVLGRWREGVRIVVTSGLPIVYAAIATLATRWLVVRVTANLWAQGSVGLAVVGLLLLPIAILLRKNLRGVFSR